MPNSRDPKPEPLDMFAATTGQFSLNYGSKQYSPVDKMRNNELLSPTGTQASDYELSYLREPVADEPPRKPAPIRKGTADAKNYDIKVRFPSTKERRTGSASTSSSSYASSSGLSARPGINLERSLSAPLEAASSPSYTQPSSKDAQADRLKAQLSHPTRSNTSPSLGSSRTSQDIPTTRRRSEKICVKCSKRIVDGKWVLVDQEMGGGGKVLCEYDWKMLYLPKCRRCDRPIEGQAIGSSDGQIKGKYHRECFNCTTCQVRPSFPTKIGGMFRLSRIIFPSRNNRGRSRTSHFTYSTANRFASTTTTKRTTRSAPHLDADCPLRDRAPSRTMVTGTTQPTFCANSAMDRVARPASMASIGSSTDYDSATATRASIRPGAKTPI